MNMLIHYMEVFQFFLNGRYHAVVYTFQDIFISGRERDHKYAIQIKADDDIYDYRRDENGNLIRFEPVKS